MSPITPTLRADSPVRREASATLRLAGPLVGGNLAGIGMNFVDTVMAGRLDAGALAAVAIGASVWSTINLFLMGVLLALPPLIARRDGAGRRDEIAPFARQGLWVAMGLAATSIVLARSVRPVLELTGVQPELVPTVLGYLAALTWGMPAWCAYVVLRFTSDGLGATRPTLYIGLLGMAVNAFANWMLMYGKLGFPAFGAIGTGMATAVVWWVELAAMLVYVRLHPRYRSLGLFAKLERPNRRSIGEILRVGLPIGGMIFFEGSLFGTVALLLGSLGTHVVAGHMVALNFSAIAFMVPLGISMAISVRVGNALGRKDFRAVRRAAFVGTGLALTSQAMAAAVMAIAPGLVARIYTDDPAVLAVAVQLLLLAAVFQISDGVQASAAGALRGVADTRVPLLITGLAYWCVGFSLGWWLGFPLGLGAPGMWVGLIAGLTVAGALLTARFLRITRAGGPLEARA